MSLLLLTEETVATRDVWLSQLNQAEFQQLIGAQALRPHRADTWVLEFVGVMVSDERVIFSQPKFSSGRVFDLAGTLRVLRAYFQQGRQRQAITDRFRDPEYPDQAVLREFDLLSGLREWFAAHGLYRREQARQSSVGRPHWSRTIALETPLIVQGSVVYPQVIAEKREGILSDISALQVGVLNRLMEKYEIEVPSFMRHAELATGKVVHQWPLRPDVQSYFLQRLNVEQQSVFRSDTLRLFSLLRAALSTPMPHAEPAGRPQIFGTTAFYAVWEDGCRAVLGGPANTPSVSLAPPVWYVPGSDATKHRHPHSQRPDLIVDRDTSRFVIDAKYYYPFPALRPGGPDIIKQLFYALALPDDGREVSSLFLVPMPEAASPTFLGYATVEHASRAFDRIEAWGLDPDWLFEGYPAPSARCTDQLIDAVLDARQCVSEFIAEAPTDVGG